MLFGTRDSPFLVHNPWASTAGSEDRFWLWRMDMSAEQSHREEKHFTHFIRLCDTGEVIGRLAIPGRAGINWVGMAQFIPFDGNTTMVSVREEDAVLYKEITE